jgi:hypothetical protein
MKRLIAVLAALAFGQAFAAPPVYTQEVLVLHSGPTLIPRSAGTRGLEIFNNGPNKIWCALSGDAGTAVSTKSRPISAGASWSVDALSFQAIYCLADTADQVTGAATIVSEVL